MDNKKKKVILAISGGVDSSVSAYLLQKEGYEVIGVFMRLTDSQKKSEDYARRVCEYLGIKFYPVNISDKFEEEIIDYFINSYKDGITPNPCVKCNKLIKFGELFRVMEELGGDYLATGHYLRLQRRIKNDKYFNSTGGLRINKIYKGSDNNKDQTYFLYNLVQDQLDKVLFPVGGMEKMEVRKIADENHIPYLKGESQDVCFLVEDGRIIEHNDYLKKKIKLKPGDIKTNDGVVLGQHIGLPFYTIGQRRGIEIGGTGPYYAARLDYSTNTLYVVNDPSDPTLFSDYLFAKDVNWISGEEVDDLKCEAVIRYRHKPVACSVLKQTDESYKVLFEEAQRAVTPGQSVVFYSGDELLGGGVII